MLLCSPVRGDGSARRHGAIARLPLTQNGGTWASGHVQGIAVDVQGGYIYYSFTNLLAKYDFSGKLIGTLVGWTGHLGDLDFNPADGKVYGSLEYKKDKAFYIAVIDVKRLDRVGIEASKTEIFRTVYLPEVVKDYVADMDGDGNSMAMRGPPLRLLRNRRRGFWPRIRPCRWSALSHRRLWRLRQHRARRQRSSSASSVRHQRLEQVRQAAERGGAAPQRPETLQGKYFVRTGNTT